MDEEIGEVYTSASYNIKAKNKYKAQKLSKEKGFRSVSSFMDKLIEGVE